MHEKLFTVYRDQTDSSHLSITDYHFGVFHHLQAAILMRSENEK